MEREYAFMTMELDMKDNLKKAKDGVTELCFFKAEINTRDRYPIKDLLKR